MSTEKPAIRVFVACADLTLLRRVSDELCAAGALPIAADLSHLPAGKGDATLIFADGFPRASILACVERCLVSSRMVLLVSDDASIVSTSLRERTSVVTLPSATWPSCGVEAVLAFFRDSSMGGGQSTPELPFTD